MDKELLKSALNNTELLKSIDGYNLTPYAEGDRRLKLAVDENPRLGAVMILWFETGGDFKFVVIERSSYDGVHSGQMALPGGKKDAEDDDLITTAIRECYEEVGVKPDGVEVLGCLNDVYIPPSRFLVTPVVGITANHPQWVLQEREVADYIEVSLTELLSDSSLVDTTVTIQGGMKLKTPAFDFSGKIVWGATAIILSQMKQVLLSIS